MKWSELMLPTLKETPAEAEAASHILMLRAGLIRKISAGVYTYLPLGVLVLRAVERIIREEMNAGGAQELLMPAIQPPELWVKSGRLAALGQDMITFIDRHKRQNVLGPTHEEVVTTLIKQEVNSYKQLPLIVYQIQTKFRDEARPRSGVMRAREFIMKDAYSFDVDGAGLDESYKKMYQAYCRIFQRCGLRYLAVEADTGMMGGDVSHEFMVLSDSGEDVVAACPACGYAASADMAACVCTSAIVDMPQRVPARELVPTPGQRTVEQICAFLELQPRQLIKTLIYVADNQPLIVIIRGDHQVNEAKLKRALAVADLQLADTALIESITGGAVGFSGPVGLGDVTLIADQSLSTATDYVAGANQLDTHVRHVDLSRDVAVSRWADIRTIQEADPCPRCRNAVRLSAAIEVGHVFKLGTRYTQRLAAKCVDRTGVEQIIMMGCYGIGVTRLIAACIEQHHDRAGITWPLAIAPAAVVLLALNPADQKTQEIAMMLYEQLLSGGIATLYDDRNIRAGIKFKDADLIGIPLQLIIGERLLGSDTVELVVRRTGERAVVPIAGAVVALRDALLRLE